MNIKRWLVSIIIVLTVIASLGFTKFTQIQAAIAFGESFPEPSATVKSTYVQTIQHSKSSKVVGQLTAPSMLTVSNEYPGPITFVGFKPGDIVQQGQVLLRQDTSVEKANLTAAKARVKLAKSTYARMTKLLKQKRISPDEVDKAEADVAIASAEVDNLSSVISKKTITAPFSGRVGLTPYQVGQLLDANTQITSLVGLDKHIWVDFSVPQTLTQPRMNDTVRIKLSQASSQQLSATVIAKKPSVDMNSRQQGYRAQLNNAQGEFSHNQMVSVYVPMANAQAVVVPSNAVTRSHFGEFVYILEKDEQQNWRAKSVKVELGEKVGDEQIILSGLAGGEFIASEGAFKLKENLLVYTDQTLALDSSNGGQ